MTGRRLEQGADLLLGRQPAAENMTDQETKPVFLDVLPTAVHMLAEDHADVLLGRSFRVQSQMLGQFGNVAPKRGRELAPLGICQIDHPVSIPLTTTRNGEVDVSPSVRREGRLKTTSPAAPTWPICAPWARGRRWPTPVGRR